MSDAKLKKFVLACMFAALTALMTTVIRVPSPTGGYVNLGDCAVLLSAWILGPGVGCAAAGVGSMLSDLLGYPLYAPGTLVIKGAMALTAGYVSHALQRGGPVRSLPVLAVSGAAAELLMAAGYFLYEASPFPVGLGLGALANLPFNLVQGMFGLVSAMAVYLALFRSHALARL